MLFEVIHKNLQILYLISSKKKKEVVEFWFLFYMV